MIAFRHADPRLPFFHEDARQPPARWHAAGEGPVQYLADTADGTWAEFLRHEEIRDPADVPTIRRAIWAVEIGDEPAVRPALSDRILTGGAATYEACRQEAARLRTQHATRLDAPSAALRPGSSGQVVNGRLHPGPVRAATTIVLFGRRPGLVGWRAAYQGRPAVELLKHIRHFDEP